MLYKILGDSKVEIPAIAQGTSGMGSYDRFDTHIVDERMAAIRCGIDLGLTFIDTAELYGGGFCEDVLGKELEGVRNKLFIASKFNPRKGVKESFTQSLNGSLKRLRTDYIDLYQIHWPNPDIPLDNVLEALFMAVKDGKIRFVGVSNFPLQYLKDVMSFSGGRVVSNQVEYNLLDRTVEKELLPYCTNNKITLFAYSPLNQGKIFGGEDDKEAIELIAEKHGKTVSQVVLRWLVSNQQVVAVTKSSNINHVRENAAALEFELDSDDIKKINSLVGTDIVDIPLSAIRLLHPPHKKIYNSLEEAIENKFDFIPSPVVISKILTETGNMKPIRVTPTKDVSSGYLYDIDQYDVMDQVKKYWGWKIKYGDSTPIPSLVIPIEKAKADL